MTSAVDQLKELLDRHHPWNDSQCTYVCTVIAKAFRLIDSARKLDTDEDSLALPIVARSALELAFEITNSIRDPQWPRRSHRKSLEQDLKATNHLLGSNNHSSENTQSLTDQKTDLQAQIAQLESDGIRGYSVFDSASAAELLWEYRVPYFMLCRETHPDPKIIGDNLATRLEDGTFELQLDKPWDEDHRKNVRELLDSIQAYLLKVLAEFLVSRPRSFEISA